MPLHELSSPVGSLQDGWTPAEPWTYASATTFTVSGVDVTAKYSPGTRIKLTQTTVKYFVVASSSFSTNTTVTITGGSDYSLANAAITSPFFSYMANPQGFPFWFNYTPTWGGFSASPTLNFARFCVVGRLCTVEIDVATAGTSNATTLTLTIPIAASNPASFEQYRPMLAYDNGSNLTTFASLYLTNASATAGVFRDPFGNAWTSSGGKYTAGTFYYGI